MLLLFSAALLLGNPFSIKTPEKETLSFQDYLEIQAELRKINIEPLLREIYPEGQGYTSFDDFLGRCSRGIRQSLIDVDRGLLPYTIFEKINQGSSCCIVTCVPQNEKYIALAKTIPAALKKSSFDGFYLCLVGGWPNPYGKEIQYVGVPYSFKIFMILEAYKLGFDKIIWVDSAMLPLKNPKALFDQLEEGGGVLVGWNPFSSLWRYIFPATRELLFNLTGVDVLNSFYVCTRVFGLNMRKEETWSFILEYERFAKLGTPFLSCFPEEFVCTAILGTAKYFSWRRYSEFDIFQVEKDNSIVDLENPSVFFLQRNH